MATLKTRSKRPLAKDKDPMNPRITKTYSTITPESAEQGDHADNGWLDEEGHECTPDAIDLEDGKTAVTLAVEYLSNEGVIEASSSSFHPGLWYSTEFQTEDYSTGEQISYSYHLKDFSADDERAVFAAMFPKKV